MGAHYESGNKITHYVIDTVGDDLTALGSVVGEWVGLEYFLPEGLAVAWTPGTATSCILTFEIQLPDGQVFAVYKQDLTIYNPTFTTTVARAFPIGEPEGAAALVYSAGTASLIKAASKIRATATLGGTANSATELKAALIGNNVNR